MAILDPVSVGSYAYAAGFRDRGTLAKMIAIAAGESSWNTRAVNSSSGATGLWQILPSAHPEFSGWDLKDPAWNAKAAYSVYSRAPAAGKITKNKWSAYGGGRYTLALPMAEAAAATVVAAGGTAGPGSAVDQLGQGVEGAADVVSSGAGAAEAAAEVAAKLTDPGTWLRFAYGAVGVALVVGAVVVLAKPVVAPIVKTGTKVAKVAATKKPA
jgi:hypothetical protein